MAELHLTYDQASERLLSWYYNMRVDYLTVDELNYELQARLINLDITTVLTRKRKYLRDKLKSEKLTGVKGFTGIFTGDAQLEAKTCMKKFTELNSALNQSNGREDKSINSTRLVHLGARIAILLSSSRDSPNLHGHLQNLLVNIVETLEPVLDNLAGIEELVVTEVGQEIPVSENLAGNEESLSAEANQQQPVLENLAGNAQPVVESESIGEPVFENLAGNVVQRIPVPNILVRSISSENSQSQNFEGFSLSSQVENPPTNKPTNSRLSHEDLEWIYQLQMRVLALESELAKRKGRDIGTQTCAAQSLLTASETQVVQNPVSANNSDQTFLIHSPLQIPPHSNQNPIHNLPKPNLSFQNPNLTSNPLFINASNPGNAPNLASNAAPPGLLNLQHNPNSSHPPYANDITSQNQFIPQQYRYSLPVSKWNIIKYSGDDQGLQLNEFLELVQALSQAEHVTEQTLFESAVHLFTGSALKWYMTQRATGRLLNWQHLVFELRKTYMHPDLDALIKIKIYQRRQQRNESFHEFYFEVEKMFRTMSMQIPDFEKMQIIQQNMRLDYRRQMTFLPITDLQTLVSAGQKLDALNFSAYSKVFSNDKTVQAIQDRGTNSTSKREKNQSQSWQTQANRTNQNHSTDLNKNNSTSSDLSRKQSGQPNSPRSQRRAEYSGQTQTTPRENGRTINSNSSSDSQLKPSSSRVEQYSTRNPNSSGSQVRPTDSQTNRFSQSSLSGSQSKSSLTLAEVIGNHIPPPSNTCYNCGRLGHHEAMCRQPREIFCSTCGIHGFPTQFCPYCIKNTLVANENRSSPKQNA